MAGRLRFTILGCGSSPGVPRVIGDWGNCDPTEPKNRRTRCAAMAELAAENGGVTRVVIDTGPDFRAQMLGADVRRLDAVIYTHAHADHIHGVDDLRGFWHEQRRLIDIFADASTLNRLNQAFGYCFATPAGSSYPPILRANLIDHGKPVVIEGDGGALTFEPLPQVHGDIVSLGFRIGTLAYCPDVSAFPPSTAERLRDLDVLVIDALQYRTHPSHFSLAETLDWIDRLKPRRAILTHMHTPLDYATVLRETPHNVEPAFDGLTIELDCESGS